MTARRNLLLAAGLAALLAACQTVTPPIDPGPDGRFHAPESFAAGASPHSVAVADLDGDGLLDLVVALSEADAVAVLMGAGDRAFAAPVLLPAGVWPQHAIVVDLDGDGALDIIVAATGDDTEETVFVIPGDGDGTFGAAIGYASCNAPHQVAVGDFDGDGALDVAVACLTDAHVAVLPGGGDGTLGAPLTFGVGAAGGHAVVAADLDGDGLDDLAVAVVDNSTMAVLIASGTAGAIDFEPFVAYHGGTQPHGMAVGDLTGDGRPDIVTANQGSDELVVYLNAGDGTFVDAAYAVGPVPKDVAIGDVDGDGVPDLVSANVHDEAADGEPTTITVLYGVGDGTFGGAETFEVGQTPFSLALADLDGDGHADVVTANWHTDDVKVLFNTGLEPE